MHLNPVVYLRSEGKSPFNRPRRNNAVGGEAESRSIILIPSNRICESPRRIGFIVSNDAQDRLREVRRANNRSDWEIRDETILVVLRETWCNTMTTRQRRNSYKKPYEEEPSTTFSLTVSSDSAKDITFRDYI